ncbi:MAG TPA: PVC-type heme-binding CxxCH protein [Bryobacteraceae bacterium]|nr:PVC-type heme-binding CxxCH protein [Bryobacteraceae bacterium]
MKQSRPVLLLAFLALLSCARKPAGAPALSPQEALKSFHLSEDFRLELFAAEPQVVDPVEMAFDENGRVYVAEMLDYPEDPPPGKPARSRIRLLEDTDGDGKLDRSVIYADQVLEVSGLMPWKGGLIVTSAPDILFMQDTNGDGKADVRKVLYTGFGKFNPEGRITNLRLGVDNWVYAANMGHEGRITSVEHPERPPIEVRGGDFRFHLIRGVAEAASGPTQFGMTFDNWGNRFSTQNTVHLRNVVLPMQYLARSPLLDPGAAETDISDHGQPSVRVFPLTKPQAWREQRTAIRQKRYDENNLNRKEEVGGFFTAASGGTVYTGDAFPPEYVGNILTGDVNGNLVHRDIVKPAGVTFTASRAKEGVEFMASTDSWSRICNFANAPDGNLYMTDIYREFIETPESIPESIKKNMNFWSGDTMGRIYRLVPNKPRLTRGLKPNLGAASVEELVKTLGHENGWHRQTAQRLLLERQEKSAIPALRALTRSENPLARLHALWTLEGLGGLEAGDVERALKDPHAGIREHAVRLAEGFLPRLAGPVLALASDPEPRVQFQLAFSLGQLKDPRSLGALAAIAANHDKDRWFRVAVLSSVGDSAGAFLQTMITRNVTEIVPPLATLVGGRRNPAELSQALAVMAKMKEPAPALNGLAKGLRLTGAAGLKAPAAEAPLMALIDSQSEPVRDAAWEVARHFELRALVAKAAADALDAKAPLKRRVVAIRALRGGRFAQADEVVKKILESNAPPELQTASVETLAAFDDPSVPGTLLHYWRGYSPAARVKVVAAMLSVKPRVPVLLKALEDGQVEVAALDVAARTRLLEQGDRARSVLKNQAGDRAKVVEAYADVLNLKGDVGRGKSLFDENCAKCHMPRKQGGRVGPDLSGINNKTRDELLTSILNPSYAIEPQFTHYIVTTRDGHVHDGVLANESPAVITLRGGAEEGDETILRANIQEIRASSISLMPEELEKSIDKQGLADVIAYLRGGL